MSEDQVIKDVLLAAQPTKEFVAVRAGCFAGAVPVRPRRRADHRRQPLNRWRLDGRVEPAECNTGS